VADSTGRVLWVAVYESTQIASRSYQLLMEDVECASTLEVAVLIRRASDGKATIQEAGVGCSNDTLDVLTPLAIGLFAPPMLIAEAIDGGFGDVVARLTQRHDAGQVGFPVDQFLPPESSAIALLGGDSISADAVELPRRSDCCAAVVINPSDYETLRSAISRSKARSPEQIIDRFSVVDGSSPNCSE
jgi:hypothetical protein